mmetsp:Transcript_17401/g.24952  ORF Transcript_17401/g.24952 Transcript_17401/m.24952 type:complete len:91 (-) Transcript_17401:27-299(-)
MRTWSLLTCFGLYICYAGSVEAGPGPYYSTPSQLAGSYCSNIRNCYKVYKKSKGAHVFTDSGLFTRQVEISESESDLLNEDSTDGKLRWL